MYFPERIWPRLVPKGSVMVSIFGPGGEQAYGVLSNLSEGGAQFVTGVAFESGSRVLLRIGFDPEEPFSTAAEVIWMRDESDAKHKQSYVHGVKFRIEDPEHRAALSEILESRDFVHPVLPGEPAARGLDGVLSDLGDELEELGDKLGGARLGAPKSGRER